MSSIVTQIDFLTFITEKRKKQGRCLTIFQPLNFVSVQHSFTSKLEFCNLQCNVFLLIRNRSIAKLSAMKDHCALFSLRLINPIPNKSRCLKMLPKDSKPQSLQKPEMTTDHEDHASLIKLIYIIQMFQYQKKQVHHIQKIKLFV